MRYSFVETMSTEINWQPPHWNLYGHLPSTFRAINVRLSFAFFPPLSKAHPCLIRSVSKDFTDTARIRFGSGTDDGRTTGEESQKETPIWQGKGNVSDMMIGSQTFRGGYQITQPHIHKYGLS